MQLACCINVRAVLGNLFTYLELFTYSRIKVLANGHLRFVIVQTRILDVDYVILGVYAIPVIIERHSTR